MSNSTKYISFVTKCQVESNMFISTQIFGLRPNNTIFQVRFDMAHIIWAIFSSVPGVTDKIKPGGQR